MALKELYTNYIEDNRQDIGNPDLPGEVWKPVPGFGDRYLASNKGRVKLIKGSKSGKKVKIIDSYINARTGYECLKLHVNGKTYSKQAHQIVALAWIGECPENHEVNHKDGNRLNNTPENLEYLTRKQNIRHAFNHKNYDQYEVVAVFSLTTKEEAQQIKNRLQTVFHDMPLVIK